MTHMSREQIQSILNQIQGLEPQDRVVLADEVDRMTWRDRVQALMARVRQRQEQGQAIEEEEIDRIVDEVRSEKPLFERYWTRQRRSAP